jgi:hypothetical protein
MKDERTASADKLERAAAAVRRGAEGLAPSARSLEALLETLGAIERGSLAAGSGAVSLAEETLMKKWRMHDAFRPLSFESLERRRMLAVIVQGSDGAAEQAWPQSFVMPATYVTGGWALRAAGDPPRPTPAQAAVLEQLDAMAIEADVFGSQLILAA